MNDARPQGADSIRKPYVKPEITAHESMAGTVAFTYYYTVYFYYYR